MCESSPYIKYSMAELIGPWTTDPSNKKKINFGQLGHMCPVDVKGLVKKRIFSSFFIVLNPLTTIRKSVQFSKDSLINEALRLSSQIRGAHRSVDH